VTVEILYCPTWSGYDQRAASLAAEIESETDAVATVTPGGRGQFDVLVDGELLFSKQERGRFPEPGEIVTRL